MAAVNISGFKEYAYSEGKVIRVLSGKEMKPYDTAKKGRLYKLKNDAGKWVGISAARVAALAGVIMDLPSTAKAVYGSNGTTYIDVDGVVYIFGRSTSGGKVATQREGAKGYPAVSIWYKGKRRSCDVHKLMAETFLMNDYTDKGLCCMHRDNVKTNCRLDNLSIGTYSQNNKDAYSDGINPGNGLKASALSS